VVTGTTPRRVSGPWHVSVTRTDTVPTTTVLLSSSSSPPPPTVQGFVNETVSYRCQTIRFIFKTVSIFFPSARYRIPSTPEPRVDLSNIYNYTRARARIPVPTCHARLSLYRTRSLQVLERSARPEITYLPRPVRFETVYRPTCTRIATRKITWSPTNSFAIKKTKTIPDSLFPTRRRNALSYRTALNGFHFSNRVSYTVFGVKSR